MIQSNLCVWKRIKIHCNTNDLRMKKEKILRKSFNDNQIMVKTIVVYFCYYYFIRVPFRSIAKCPICDCDCVFVFAEFSRNQIPRITTQSYLDSFHSISIWSALIKCDPCCLTECRSLTLLLCALCVFISHSILELNFSVFFPFHTFNGFIPRLSLFILLLTLLLLPFRQEW